MSIEIAANGDAWWDGLSNKEKKAYIEKHPRSKYAKKMGGTGGKPASTAPTKKPSATSPLPAAKPKAKKKMDPAKKKARISKVKEMIKKAELRVKKADTNEEKHELYVNYLKKLYQHWEEAYNVKAMSPYKDRVNKKLISVNTRLDKAIGRNDKVTERYNKAKENLRKQQNRLKEIQTAAPNVDSKLALLDYLIEEAQLYETYLQNLRKLRFVNKPVITKRIVKTKQRLKKLDKKRNELKGK